MAKTTDSGSEPPAKRYAGRDRRGDSRAGCHVGDALEQDLTQADCVPPESG